MNLIKSTFIVLAILIAVIIPTYAGFSFIELGVNPFAWSLEGRIFSALFVFFHTLVFSIISLSEDEGSKDFILWVARDKNGELNIFKYKPTKNIEFGVWIAVNGKELDWLCVKSWEFPNVEWEDNEPTKIKLKK